MISLVFLLVGMMMAIQFQTAQEPEKRDTRDLWEIRAELEQEQKTQQELYQQLAEVELTIDQYNKQSDREKIETLKSSLEDLREKAGLTEVTGGGVRITISPIFFESVSGQKYPSVTPELLSRLLNEINNYGATQVAIENERIVNVSPIRLVNGKTYVNNHPLPPLPIEIKVLSENPKKMLDYVQVSQAKDNFAIEELELTAEVVDELTLPNYEAPIDLEGLEVKEPEEKGDE